MTPRLHDWQTRLQALIDSRLHAPFEWGRHDCCLFVCDAIEAMTGHDPAKDLRGYSDERGAARILRDAGGVAAYADARAGPEVAPSIAQIGDVGLVITDGRESLALCAGAHWLSVGADGLKSLPITAASRAWSAI